LAKAKKPTGRKVTFTHRTKAVAAGEKALGSALTRGLKAIAKDAAKLAAEALGKAAGDTQTDSVMGGLDWAPIAASLKVQLVAVAKDGAKNAMIALGVSDDDITDQVFDSAVDWATARSAELVGKSWDEDGNLIDNPDADMAISETIRDAIRAQVADAIEQGLPAKDLADNIEELGEFSEDRAMMIARTEIIRAHAQGQLAAMKNSGVVEKKAWSTSEDGDQCDDCDANAEQEGIPLDDDFQSGDDAPPCHPNCRCALVASFDEDEETEEEDSEEDESEDATEAAE
jgi:SPP1 gp7 family putative phage head morphogenesis protein